MDCDVLIVGGGAAGCTAACMLSRYKTCIVSSGPPATAMSTGRISITNENDPAAPQLSDFIKQIGSRYGLFVKQEKTKSFTNKGTEYEQSFASSYDCTAEDCAAAGIKGNNDLDPELFSRIAASSGKKISPYMLEGDLCEALQEIPHDEIIIPPLFSLEDYMRMGDLEKKCGRRLREAATPLSLPGKRLSECLRSAAERSGAEILAGREVVETAGNTALAVSGIREQIITYSALVLAGGNIIGGGLELDGNMVREPLLNLTVTEKSGKRLKSQSLSEVLSAGICAHGCRAAAGVYGCGAIVSGTSYPLNKGLWDVMLSAVRAAEAVKEDLQ